LIHKPTSLIDSINDVPPVATPPVDLATRAAYPKLIVGTVCARGHQVPHILLRSRSEAAPTLSTSRHLHTQRQTKSHGDGSQLPCVSLSFHEESRLSRPQGLPEQGHVPSEQHSPFIFSQLEEFLVGSVLDVICVEPTDPEPAIQRAEHPIDEKRWRYIRLPFRFVV